MIKTIQSIDVADWDNTVKTTYGRPYSFQQQDGCKDRGIEYITVPITRPEDHEDTEVEDDDYTMGVSFAAWLARDPALPFGNDDPAYAWRSETIWERNFYPHVDMIANDLHARGLLPAGQYQIVIDW